MKRAEQEGIKAAYHFRLALQNECQANAAGFATLWTSQPICQNGPRIHHLHGAWPARGIELGTRFGFFQ